MDSRLRASGSDQSRRAALPRAKAEKMTGFRLRPSGSRPEVWSLKPKVRLRSELLDLDLRADFVEFLSDGFRLFLGNPFLQDLGHRLDEILGFLQTEAGDFADCLDDVDLLVR